MQKLIPPFLLIIAIIVMVLLHIFVPFQINIPFPLNCIGVFLIISGLIITKIVSNQFSQINTEIHTFKRPRAMVTSGLFRYSRNPIYLGFTIILIGLNVVLGSLTPFIVVLFFIFLTNYWYIPFEENNMKKLFGEDYENYKKIVRRWI